PTDGSIDNFGWPCYEGNARQSGYDAADLSLCESLYAQSAAVTAPYYQYAHSDQVAPNDPCPTGSTAIAGLAFAPSAGGTSPPAYAGALFFADNARDCIWVMKVGADGRPSPYLIETFVAGAANPVDLQIGPGGELYYIDFDGGTIRRVRYVWNTTAPT